MLTRVGPKAVDPKLLLSKLISVRQSCATSATSLTPMALNEFTTKNEAMLQQAETTMENARQVCDRLQLAPRHRTLLLGQLDVRCITHFKKIEKEHENVKYASFDAISEAP